MCVWTMSDWQSWLEIVPSLRKPQKAHSHWWHSGCVQPHFRRQVAWGCHVARIGQATHKHAIIILFLSWLGCLKKKYLWSLVIIMGIYIYIGNYNCLIQPKHPSGNDHISHRKGKGFPHLPNHLGRVHVIVPRRPNVIKCDPKFAGGRMYNINL